MGKSNGKREVEGIDVEHELPAGDGDQPTSGADVSAAAAQGTGPDAEMQKLRAERDTAVDRLARMQAELEELRQEIVDLKQQFAAFRRQFE